MRKLSYSGFARGIGLHHPGLSLNYRSAVEAFIRCRQLRVVFATESLALGINMPCRTVVFLNDSFSFTPLKFQQMGGRAGRRGIDFEGQILSMGLSKDRLNYLLCGSLPDDPPKPYQLIDSVLLYRLLDTSSLNELRQQGKTKNKTPASEHFKRLSERFSSCPSGSEG